MLDGALWVLFSARMVGFVLHKFPQSGTSADKQSNGEDRNMSNAPGAVKGSCKLGMMSHVYFQRCTFLYIYIYLFIYLSLSLSLARLSGYAVSLSSSDPIRLTHISCTLKVKSLNASPITVGIQVCVHLSNIDAHTTKHIAWMHLHRIYIYIYM